MLLLKFLLMFMGAGLLGGALAIVIYDVYRTRQSWRQDQADATRPLPPGEIRWRLAARLALVSMAPLLLGQSFVVVPSGRAGVLCRRASFYPDGLSARLRVSSAPASHDRGGPHGSVPRAL